MVHTGYSTIMIMIVIVYHFCRINSYNYPGGVGDGLPPVMLEYTLRTVKRIYTYISFNSDIS